VQTHSSTLIVVAFDVICVLKHKANLCLLVPGKASAAVGLFVIQEKVCHFLWYFKRKDVNFLNRREDVKFLNRVVANSEKTGLSLYIPR
jgi:hypothetical protein